MNVSTIVGFVLVAALGWIVAFLVDMVVGPVLTGLVCYLVGVYIGLYVILRYAVVKPDRMARYVKEERARRDA